MKVRLSMGIVLAAGFALAGCDGSDDSTPGDQAGNDGGGNTNGDAIAGGDPKCVPSFQSTGNPQAVRQYCVQFGAAVCQRAFSDCATQLAGFASGYTSADQCNAAEEQRCDGDFSSLDVDPAAASACINTLTTAACTLFTSGEPQECANALLALPPSSAGCTPIGPGSLQGEIVASDPLYAGGHIKTYCLCLTAGQAIDVLTADPGGGAIPDSYLFLFGPDGNAVAEADDIAADNFFSHIGNQVVPTTGSYMIVVSGFHDNDLGGYRLIVHVQ